MDLGNRLRCWRLSKRLTLRVVSERSGVGLQTISEAEVGSSAIRYRAVNAIVTKAFKITMIEFLRRVPAIPKDLPNWGGRPRTVSKPARYAA